jgi:SNF2 family DNA or RNA helicase
MVYVDESTRIANPDSKRTREVVQIGRLAAMRAIFSGLPVKKSPLDLYSQFDFLGDRLLGHGSFYTYRSEFAVLQDKNFGGRKVKVPVAYKNMERLESRIERLSYRKLKDECLDLPPKVYMPPRHVEMTDQQWDVYGQIRARALAELEGGELVTAMSAITQIMKLHQVCTGFVKDEQGIEHELPCRRMEVLGEVLEEVGESTVIWAHYRQNIRRIAEFLREGYGSGEVVEYHGDVPPDQRVEAIRRFQEGRVRFFVGTPQAGGIGITLNRAHAAVYYSSGYDLELRLQSEDRTHRGEMSHSCAYADLICEGTVEEKIISALRKKMDIAALVLGEAAREWLV